MSKHLLSKNMKFFISVIMNITKYLEIIKNFNVTFVQLFFSFYLIIIYYFIRSKYNLRIKTSQEITSFLKKKENLLLKENLKVTHKEKFFFNFLSLLFFFFFQLHCIK